VTTEDQVRGRK